MNKNWERSLGNNGTCFFSQHLGDRARQISEVEDNLIYRIISTTAMAMQRNLVSKKKPNNKQINKTQENRSQTITI